MRALLVLLALLPAACADIRPGSPEACAFEPRGTFTMEMRTGRPFVEARINGEKARLLLDTGANLTFITASAADRLKLRGDGVYRSTTKAIGGETPSTPAQVDRFEFAGIALPVRHVISVPLDPQSTDNADGLLGIDALRQFDVALDMRGRTGTLYRARNCPEGTPPGMTAVRGFDMPASSTSPHPEITVELDGRPMVALLDTGANNVLVNRAVALRMGVTEEALAADRTITIAGAVTADVKSAVHRFRMLRIGDMRFDNPALRVVSMPPSGADMLIGMPLLQNRKVWFSFASRKIYIGNPTPGT
jgi:predicted aspartyl protease